MTNNLDEEREWMRRMAEIEDGCCVTAGGLVATLGMLDPPVASQRAPVCDPRRIALAKFVEFSRRKMALTVAEFAERSGVDVVDVLRIEDEGASIPPPAVVVSIAHLIGADVAKLLDLAGHTRVHDDSLDREALRFAAGAEGAEPLTDAEERILGEFARIVVARAL